MRKPNLFVVGAPRSGTTSFIIWLNEHPDIYFNLVREPLYFADDIVKKKAIRNKKEYLNLFKKGKNKKYIGEKSVHYIYSKVAAKKIKKFNPDAKILIFVRKRGEMEKSYEKFRKGYEKFGNIKESVVKNIGNFKEGIKRFKKVFGRNLKIIKFEDLKDKPEETYNGVLDFLGLKHHKANFKIYNKQLKKGSRIVIMLNQFVPKRLKKLLPQKIRVMFREMLR